jgi:hypothetical protein
MAAFCTREIDGSSETDRVHSARGSAERNPWFNERSRLARNIPLFIAFRVLFNALLVYPVLAVLFLDFGLSVQEYALLNVAWAAAIVGLEVPLGPWPTNGRKRMVVFAAILMVWKWRYLPSLLAEILAALRAFPRESCAQWRCRSQRQWRRRGSRLRFPRCRGTGKRVARHLGALMRWQAVAFFVTMMAGAAVYDASFVQWILNALNVPWTVSPDMALRFPIYLTLGNAVLALLATINLREPERRETARVSVRTTWRVTFKAGRWIAQTPLAFGVILAGMCFDSIVRLFLTVASNYYRLIAVPEAAFGLIGSGFAVIGFLIPALARRLVARWKVTGNLALVAGLTFAGLSGAAFVWPVFGLLWLVPLGAAMSLIQFYVSHYLNQAVTDPRQRPRP